MAPHPQATTKHYTTSTTQTSLMHTTWPNKPSPEHHPTSSNAPTQSGNPNLETTTTADRTNAQTLAPTTHKSSGEQFAKQTAQQDLLPSNHSTRVKMAQSHRHQLTTKSHTYYIVHVGDPLHKEAALSRPKSPLTHPQILYLFQNRVIRSLP